MKIEINHTYKIGINGTTVILSQLQARELYDVLNKEFGKEHQNPIQHWPCGDYRVGDIPNSIQPNYNNIGSFEK